MAKSAAPRAPQPAAPAAPPASAAQRPVRVAVAGGGIAGMSAALRLAQRGYAVTLYEEKPWLGGNLASHRDAASGTVHDVYPHMFSNFYVNFWDIVENELGLKRDRSADTDFEARDSFVFLDRAQGYRALRNASDLKSLWQDMSSGVGQLAPLDLYLYLYSMLDLLAHRFHVRGLIELSLNGYVRSRPCITEPAARMHDAIVMFIWSIHSAGTSAESYQNFYRHTFGNVQPLLWLLRGSLQRKVIEPLERRLVQLGVKVHKQASVQRVVLDGARVGAIELRRTEYDEQRHRVLVTERKLRAEPFDQLVLAVPPHALGVLAERGGAARRLGTLDPKLAHAGKRLPAEPIAVLDLYFKRKLAGIPRENIAVTDSDCYFSIIDISQLWPEIEKEGITALTLAASDYWALPSDDDRANAHHLIRELARYVPGFDPGRGWGDPHCDIDWRRSHFRSNKDDVIFVNQVGSWEYRPETHDGRVENLYFAGDFCRNRVDMATVEAAVTSGLNAAAALQRNVPSGQRGPAGEPVEVPIEIRVPPMVGDAALCALKLWLMPSAYLAKAWLTATDASAKLGGRAAAAGVAQDLTTLARLPYQYAVDAIETVGAMCEAGVAQAVED
jgi:phytoene dehydrogenase-like protein